MDGLVRTGYGYLPDLPDEDWKMSAVGDFDGDGLIDDIAWRNRATGQSAIWLMTDTVRYSFAYLGTRSDTRAWSIVGAADFDGNGTTDLVWHEDTEISETGNIPEGRIQIWYMDGTTKTGVGHGPTFSGLSWKIVAVADYNGDGKPDLVWRNQDPFSSAQGQNAIWYMDDTTQLGLEYLMEVDDSSWWIEGPQ